MKENFKGPVECYEYFSREAVLLENNDSLNKAYTDSTYRTYVRYWIFQNVLFVLLYVYCLYTNTDLTCLYQNPIWFEMLENDFEKRKPIGTYHSMPKRSWKSTYTNTCVTITKFTLVYITQSIIIVYLTLGFTNMHYCSTFNRYL